MATTLLLSAPQRNGSDVMTRWSRIATFTMFFRAKDICYSTSNSDWSTLYEGIIAIWGHGTGESRRRGAERAYFSVILNL